MTTDPGNSDTNAPRFEAPEKSTIKDMLTISWVLALIVGVILILTGVLTLGITAVFGVIDIIVFYECREIIRLTEKRQLTAAKEKTLIWMIVGFIFGFIIVGLFMLIAYIKFDDLIRAYQNSSSQQIH